MAEYQPKTICWSCGRQIENCACGGDNHAQPITITPPKEVLPACGLSASEGTSPESMVYYKNATMERPCCICGEKWMSTITEWITGSCPRCGASGSDGYGPSTENTTLAEPKKTTFSKDFFGDIKETHVNDISDVKKIGKQVPTKVTF